MNGSQTLVSRFLFYTLKVFALAGLSDKLAAYFFESQSRL